MPEGEVRLVVGGRGGAKKQKAGTPAFCRNAADLFGNRVLECLQWGDFDDVASRFGLDGDLFAGEG